MGTVDEILSGHVTLEAGYVDRLYLIPKIAYDPAVEPRLRNGQGGNGCGKD